MGEKVGSNSDIQLVGQTASTNELALAAIDDGAPAGTAFVADCQTAGRGRRSTGGERRAWFSPPGKNLYLSVVVRPNVDVAAASGITLAVGAVLVELLRETTGVDVQLKWPNDLYANDRKLGGILTEATSGAGGLKAAVVGLGLNVNVGTDEFPEPLRPVATSLYAESEQRHDRMSLALRIIDAVIGAADEFESRGLAAFSQRLQQWNYLEGRRVSVDGCPGVADAIGDDGGLVVEFDDGTRRQVVSGEVLVEGLAHGAKTGDASETEDFDPQEQK